MIRIALPSEMFYEAIRNPTLSAVLETQAKVCGEGIIRDFWLCIDEQGRPAGRICRKGTAFWGCCDNPSAAEEMAAFFRTMGGSCLEVDTEIGRALGSEKQQNFPVLAARVVLCPSALRGADIRIYPPGDPAWIKALIEIHRRCGLFARPQELDSLYSELHLRARRNAAAGALLFDAQGELASCAAISALGERTAMIGYVCTLPKKRGNRYASHLVAELARFSLSLGRLPALSCQPELSPMYRKLGFMPTGDTLTILEAF